MRAIMLILCFAFVLTTSAFAQDEYTLPDNLQPITPANVASLENIASIGGTLPGQLAWSPDGSRLAIGTSSAIHVYRADDFSSPLYSIDAGPNFFFNGTSELVSNNQRWDVETGELLPAVQNPPPTPPSSILTFTKSNGEVVTLDVGSEYTIHDVVISPDENYAALALISYPDQYPILSVQLWSIEDKATFIADLPLMLEFLETFTFHADGKLLVTAVSSNAPYGISEDIQIWDGRTGENVGPSISAYLPVQFSGELLVLMSSQGISLWTDHEIGLLKFDPMYFGEDSRPPLLFRSDSSRITTTSGNQVLIWDVNTETVPEAPRTIIQADERIVSLFYTPDEQYLITGEFNGIIKVWDAQTGTLQKRFEASTSIGAVYFSRDSQRISAIEHLGNRLVWDFDTEELILTVPSNAVMSPDLSQAAYWDGGAVRIAAMNSEQETELTVIENYFGRVTAFNPTIGWVMFAADELRGYDLSSGQQVFHQPISERAPQIIFNADGSQFIMRRSSSGVNEPLSLEVWDTDRSQQPLTSIEVPSGYGDWLLNSDGTLLSQIAGACGDGGGGSHSLWDAETGEQLADWYPGGMCGPYSHNFSPDGKWLIIGWDYLVAIINTDRVVGADDEEVFVLSYRPFNLIEDVILSADGTMMVVSIGQRNPDSADIAYRIELFHFADLIDDQDNDLLLENPLTIPDARQAIFSTGNQWLLTDNGFRRAEDGEYLASVSGNVGAFNSDSSVLAAVDSGKFALWDVAQLAEMNATPLITFDIQGVLELAFSPDDTLLYVRRAGEVQIWAVP